MGAFVNAAMDARRLMGVAMTDTTRTKDEPVPVRSREFYFNGPMWDWFGLTYSSYLVLPRTLLCGMPYEWQERMAAMIEEMKEVYDSSQINDNYTVQLRNDRGRFEKDPLASYKYPPMLPYKAISA